MILPPAVLKTVLSHAAAAYPAECCGLISISEGPSADIRVWPIRNIQDAMHQKTPQEFTRTSKTAYWMDPVELLRAQKQMRQNAAQLFMIYHSHTDSEAYFSAEDECLALDDRGEPLYPDAVYFVVPVKNGMAGDGVFFKWNSASRKFLPVG